MKDRSRLQHRISRRRLLQSMAAVPSGAVLPALLGPAPDYRLALFEADITPPLGHPLMGGGVEPAHAVVDPLSACGFVLLGDQLPLVVVVADWCEIRNDAYAQWKVRLAQAAGTTPDRVLVSCIHQHDAPIADLRAQRLLDSHGREAAVCDIGFHERAVDGVSRALRQSLQQSRRITHIGFGQAKVEEIASNRRFRAADGSIAFSRTSATRDSWARAQPEGLVDPYLKVLSFWDEDRPLAALHVYATHPMSFYGKGGVSADFPGLARQRRRLEEPGIRPIYASGCSGNVTAGKYNDGSPENRPVLADRLHDGMLRASQQVQREALRRIEFRLSHLQLEPRQDAGFSPEELQERLRSDARPFGRCLAALGLSWRRQLEAGYRIEVPCLDFGPAQLLLLPAESYVEYQLFAQRARSDSMVAVLGYGECAPGYVPTEQAWREGDTNLRDWCWVAPGSEERMHEAITQALS